MGAEKDLRKLEHDLQPMTQLEREREFNRHAVGFGITLVTLIGIWALTGAGYFWPGWVMLFGGLSLAKRAWATWSHPADADDLDY